MKIIHISDLHLGKRLHELSLIPEQEHILGQITDIARAESPDCVVIAGDVYDRAVPSAEAVTLFDRFLTSLADMELPVLLISGNHDSPERLAFGSEIMKKRNIFLSPVYDGTVEPVILRDSFGEVRFYLLPFIRPSSGKRLFPDANIENCTDIINAAVEKMCIDTSVRNVIVAHQFVTGASLSDSEELSVGGAENVDASAFDAFDYAALGHIHNPQNLGSERIRYCGTPLKYSFSEASREKSVTIAELAEKGSLTVRTVPLKPIHDLREIKGNFRDIAELPASEDYLHIILTDEDDIPDAMDRLRMRFNNLLWLSYDNMRTRASGSIGQLTAVRERSPEEIFSDFFSQRNGSDMSEEQSEYIRSLISEIWEGDK